jgi:folate-binding protein YgfZ
LEPEKLLFFKQEKQTKWLVKRTPLYEIHLDLGAEFGNVHGWELPRYYVSAVEEYVSAKKSNVIIDRTYFGKLRLWGSDALDFLNRISTNDLRGFSPGMGAGTVLTDEKGKMIDFLTIYVLKAEENYQEILALLSYEAMDKVKGWLNKLIIMDDVKFEDVSDEFVVLSIYGTGASDLIKRDFKVDHKHFLDISKMPAYNFIRGFIGDAEVILARANEFMISGYNLIFKNDFGVEIWKLLLNRGFVPIGNDVFEVLRIESGFPAYGKEITQEYNPLEANLGKFVSFSKGCYIGQEVLARIDSYNKLQRKLVGFVIEKGKTKSRVEEGSIVCSGDEEIGKLTSVDFSYGFQKVIALGYVKIKYAIQGERVEICSGDDKFQAIIVIPPFSI